ncbi:MAG: HEPN domain-containing protein [Caldilineales bacterium]|nr:HEPN domain-containing protein [Caldilineales bacterium]MDW8318420.1 HEPN domain-containing protein [Anaerolineae bacterium]
MSDDPRRALVHYRLEEAAETLAEAELLRDAGSYRGAVNRAYYAMFYALLGLLATRGLGASKHSGAIALFDREFVKTGLLAPELSRALHLAFQRRQVHDYGEITRPDRDLADESIEDARRFIEAIRNYLRDQGDSP